MERQRLQGSFRGKNYFKCKNTGEKFDFNFEREFKVQSISALTTTGIDSSLLHSRLGHCGEARLRLCPGRSTNFPNYSSLDHDPSDCDACQAGAKRRQPFPRRSKQKYTHFGQRLSSDLCGPFPPSITGKTYALVIVDAATNYLFVEYMDSKSSINVKNALEKFVRIHSSELQACRDAGFTVQWHTDNGGEFMSTELDDFCEELAIKRSFSIPYAPPLNAHAERMWGILSSVLSGSLSKSLDFLSSFGRTRWITQQTSTTLSPAGDFHNTQTLSPRPKQNPANFPTLASSAYSGVSLGTFSLNTSGLRS